MASSGRCVADSPIRCMGGASAGRRRSSRSRLSARWAPRLRARDRVDLVDDDVLDAAEDLAGLARQHQVQRFGRRDEDVGRVAGDLAPVLAGRVTGAAGDGDLRRGFAEPLRRMPDPRQRCPEVPFDVVGQRLERGHVQDADSPRVRPRSLGRRIRREPVQRPEEGGEGLAAPGRGVDERVVTGGDRRPAACLRVGRGLEARLEPLADGARERSQGIGAAGCGWWRSRDAKYRPREPIRPDVLEVERAPHGDRCRHPREDTAAATARSVARRGEQAFADLRQRGRRDDRTGETLTSLEAQPADLSGHRGAYRPRSWSTGAKSSVSTGAEPTKASTAAGPATIAVGCVSPQVAIAASTVAASSGASRGDHDDVAAAVALDGRSTADHGDVREPRGERRDLGADERRAAGSRSG